MIRSTTSVCVTTLVLSRITAVCKRACEFEIKHEHIHDEEHTSDRAHINVGQSSETFSTQSFQVRFFRFSYPSNRVHLIHASLRLRDSLIPVSLSFVPFASPTIACQTLHNLQNCQDRPLCKVVKNAENWFRTETQECRIANYGSQSANKMFIKRVLLRILAFLSDYGPWHWRVVSILIGRNNFNMSSFFLLKIYTHAGKRRVCTWTCAWCIV